MKARFLIPALSLFFVKAMYAQKDSLELKPLLFAIDSMYNVQNSPYIQAMQGEISGDSAQKKAKEIQKTNYEALKLIVARYKYPGINLYSNEYMMKFNDLMGKCDFDIHFQGEVLQYFKDASKKDTNLNNSTNYLNQLAGFIDKVEINSQRKQIYGTQVDFNEQTNKFVLKPTIDIEKINDRRKTMKLENIESVLEEANKQLMEMRAKRKID